MNVSVVIRTLNEEKYLSELLQAIKSQQGPYSIEVIIVDSGSTDRTLEIAKAGNANLVHIDKSNFTFGRSLNLGCTTAKGEYLALVSGHCIPTSEHWLSNLINPLANNTVDYVYGRQIGRDTTHFSESQVFNKYFPKEDGIPQQGFFCNNANSAVKKNIWQKYKFDEEVTGLEDMYLAKKIVTDGGKIGYTAKGCVYHIHSETWHQIKIRYEREAIALQKIMPEIHVTIWDLLNFTSTSILSDLVRASKSDVLYQNIFNIIRYRICQYWGSYRGNHEHRKLSQKAKYKYFYPE